MKLLEVLGTPEQSKETIEDYRSRLRDLKIKRVGSGIHADVYRHPKTDTIVVKVAQEWDAPMAYLRYILEHQNNPYVPKVYSVRRFERKKGRSQYYIAFIEKLKEYKLLNDKQKQRITEKHFGLDVVAFLGGGKKYNSGVFDYMTDPKGIALMRASNKKRGVPSKHLIDVLSFIGTLTGHIDLHQGNVMLRGDHLVITDPVV